MENVQRFKSSSKLYQYLATFSGCLNIACSGMHYGWTSTAFPKLLAADSHIQMSDDQSSWVASILLVGVVVGANLGTLLVDRIGRKKVILLATIPFSLSWIAIAFARSVHVILVARFVAGLLDGLTISSLPIYIGEISDPKIRGFLGSYIVFSLMSGIFVMSIIGSYLNTTTSALIGAVVPIVSLLIFCWMPESPYYLVMKGKHESAKRSLNIFKGTQDVKEELNRLIQVIHEQTTNSGKFLDLFTARNNRKALIIFVGLRTIQQLTGTTSILFYAQIIFKDAGADVSPKVASIIYFSMQLVMAGVCAVIIDKIGRKPLVIFSTIFCSLMLLTEGLYFYFLHNTSIDVSCLATLSVVVLIVYVVVYSVGMLIVPMLLLTELFPTNVKAFAISFCHSYYAVISTVVAKFFQYTKDKYGMEVPFLTFASCCMLGLLFIIFYMPETKGKTLEQIQDVLKGNELAKDRFRMEVLDESHKRTNVLTTNVDERKC